MKSGRRILPTPFFVLKIALAIQVLPCFYINHEIICFSSVNNTTGNLTKIVLNLQITLVSTVIFTILILQSKKKNGLSLHLFVSSLTSFISILQFSTYSSFVSLGDFITKYIIAFVALVNWICLISLYDFSLLIYKSVKDFCDLIL